MRRSRDIRARAEASAIDRKSRRQEDDHSLTFDPNGFGVRELNSAEIRLAVFEKRSYRRTHRQTDTSPLYKYRLEVALYSVCVKHMVVCFETCCWFLEVCSVSTLKMYYNK